MLFIWIRFGSCPLKPLIICSIVFFVSELYAYFKNYKADSEKKTSLWAVVLFPFLRIVPIFIILQIGTSLTQNSSSDNISVIVFLFIKALADMIMYVIEKTGFSKITIREQMAEIGAIYSSDGKLEFIDLKEKKKVIERQEPTIKEKLKAIEHFPEDIKREVYENLMKKEMIQKQADQINES
jgi:hypothetical protein